MKSTAFTIRRKYIKKNIKTRKERHYKKQKGGVPSPAGPSPAGVSPAAVSPAVSPASHSPALGLKINDTIITSLSGPVSFYYLKPTVDISEIEYFPLIILFGDRHESKKGSCVDCSCSEEKGKKRKCCYTISDPIFLKLLDTLSDNDNPIDFYVETFLAGTDAAVKHAYLSELTSDDMVTCYHRILHGTDYNKCPTKNIRWQVTDARVAGDTFNKVDGKYVYSRGNETFQELLKKPMKNGKRFINTVSKKFRDDVYIEFQISTLLENLENIFEYFSTFNIDDIDDIDTDEEVFDFIDNFNKFLLKGQFKTIDNFMNLLKKLYNKETNSFDFNTFSKTLFSMMTRDNSLIFKQIKKQNYLPFKEIKYWSKLYAQSLENYSRKYEFTTDNLVYLLTNLKEVIEYIVKKTNYEDVDDDAYIKKKISDMYDPLLSLELIIGNPFVDIYTLTRILKKPEGEDGKRSSLSFGYFGDIHVVNMVELLLATGNYRLVHSKRNNMDKLRCLEFDFSLDLDAELKEHNDLLHGIVKSSN